MSTTTSHSDYFAIAQKLRHRAEVAVQRSQELREKSQEIVLSVNKTLEHCEDMLKQAYGYLDSLAIQRHSDHKDGS